MHPCLKTKPRNNKTTKKWPEEDQTACMRTKRQVKWVCIWCSIIFYCCCGFELFVELQKLSNQFCTIHPTEKLSHFCVTDGCAVCSHCVYEKQHKYHEFELLSNVSHKFQSELRDLSKEMEASNKGVVDLAQKVVDLIDEMEDDIDCEGEGDN